MRFANMLPLVAVAGCATTSPEASSPCSVDNLGEWVGRPATTSLGRQAKARSRAQTLRWIRPGDVVTMDYREDRLNIHLDEQNRVARFVCG